MGRVYGKQNVYNQRRFVMSYDVDKWKEKKKK